MKYNKFTHLCLYYSTEKQVYTVAQRYIGQPVAAFYEIFNEPVALNWVRKKDVLRWEDWKDFADDIIDVIYENNPNAIPIVGGLDYCNDLSFLVLLRVLFLSKK